MGTVRIRNRGDRPFEFELSHEVCCRVSGKCSCVTFPRRGGKVAKVPSSVIITVGKEVHGLHDSVLRLPAVKAAIAARLVEASKEDKGEAATKAKPSKKTNQ